MADGDRPELGDTLDAATPAAAAVAGDALPIGAFLGRRYRIRQHVGEGGMGAVYLAHDEALQQDVALKVVNRAGRSTEGFGRLRDEVLLAQKVTHENVCRTFDLEEVDDRWFVKMEYVAGQTLAKRIDGDPLSIVEIVAIARQIAGGLAAAHARGVVHRDLKPQNVMIEEKSGRVVLMDFGIARLSSKAGETAEGIAGTPEYMAPEQARGREVDGRADLYALGCVLFRMLAGRAVFPATTPMAAALAHIEQKPDLRALRADTPPWLARLVGRLLEKDPARRPQDATETIAALAGPQPRKLLVPIAVGASAVVAAIAVVFALHGRHRREWRPIIRTHEPAFDENADAPHISPDGKQLAYASNRDGVWRLYVAPLAGGPGRALTPPTQEVTGGSWAPDGKSFYAIARQPGSPIEEHTVTERVPLDGGAPVPVADSMAGSCGDQLLVLSNDPLAITLVDPVSRGSRVLRKLEKGFKLVGCDRAGKMIAWLEDVTPNIYAQGDLWVMPIGGEPRQLTSGRETITPSFAPDGKSIVYARDHGGAINLWELPVAGGEPRRITNDVGPDIAPSVSPDGKTLVFDLDTSAFAISSVSLSTGVTRRLTNSLLDNYSNPMPTRDGKEVLATESLGTDFRVVAVSVADGTERRLESGKLMALAPSGAVVDKAHALVLVPLDGGPELPLQKPAGTLDFMRAGSDGELHAAVTGDGESQGWRIAVDGGPPVLETSPPWCLLLPAHDWLVFVTCPRGADPHGVIVPAGDGPDSPRGHSFDHRQGTVSPDGRSIITWAPEIGKIVRFDLATGVETPLAPAPPEMDELAVGIDGDSAFYTAVVGHVRRQIITNFGDRPR